MRRQGIPRGRRAGGDQVPGAQRRGARGGRRALRGGGRVHHERRGGRAGAVRPRSRARRPHPGHPREQRLRKRLHGRAGPRGRAAQRRGDGEDARHRPEARARRLDRRDRPPPADGPPARGHEGRGGASCRHARGRSRRREGRDDHRHEAEAGRRAGEDRRTHRDRGRHVQGLGHDRAEHGDDARLHHDRRRDHPRDAPPRPAPGHRRELQPRGGGRRRVDERQRVPPRLRRGGESADR